MIRSGCPKYRRLSPHLEAGELTKEKREWKKKVFDAAYAVTHPGHKPYNGRMHVELTHYYIGGTIDLDNLAKPMLDAIKGIAYEDDGPIDSLHLKRVDLESGTPISIVSGAMADAIEANRDFVHVLVQQLP